MASVLSSDGKQDPDIMAANATSVALMLSDIPWGGPIGMIRIGRISGEFIVNPSMDEVTLPYIFSGRGAYMFFLLKKHLIIACIWWRMSARCGYVRFSFLTLHIE